MDSSTFQTQLQSYEDSLLTAYRNKISLSADRESTRFQYLASLKTMFLNTMGYILQDSISSSDIDGQALLLATLNAIKSSIPMVTMTGDIIQGFGPNLFLGGPGAVPGGIGLLSPITDVAANIPTTVPTATYNDYAAMNNIFNDGDQNPFSIPPSQAWVSEVLGDVHSAGYPFMASEIVKPYNGITLDSVVGSLKSSFKDLLTKTQNFIALQLSITDLENQLSDFVTTYQQYSGSLDVPTLLKQLQAEALTAAPALIAQAVAPPTTSSLPLILSLVAGAALMFSGKK